MRCGTYFWSLDQIFGIARPCFWTHIIFIRTSFYGCFTFLAGYSLKNFDVLWFGNSRCFSDFWRRSVYFIGSSTCSWWPPSSGDYDWFEDLDLIFSASLVVLWSRRPSLLEIHGQFQTSQTLQSFRDISALEFILLPHLLVGLLYYSLVSLIVSLIICKHLGRECWCM